ncbi:MAG: TolC family protein [Chlamydiales bacterium]|nr:TolC family protein [Chlamydiales bacterium]
MPLTACKQYYSEELSQEITLADLVQGECQVPTELDIHDISQLAVLNNPSLILARDDIGVADAQVLSAGLIPDPQLLITQDFPQNFPLDTEVTMAHYIGVGYDFKALFLTPGNRKIAVHDRNKVCLTLAWQEWQIMSQARLLYVQILERTKQLALLRKIRELLLSQYEAGLQAVLERALSSDINLLYLTTLQDNSHQIHDLELQLLNDKQSLNDLLGLDPEVVLQLKDNIITAPMTSRPSPSDILHVLHCRADILALRAGYQAQEWRVRQAILGQFPALNLLGNTARDNSAIYSLGYALTIDLPIFNRNQGAIAIESATRRKLYDEYQSRLNSAYSEVQNLFAEEAIVQAQLDVVQAGVKKIGEFALNVSEAFEQGDVDLPTYVGLQVAFYNKQIEEWTTLQALLERRIAIQTLIGCHFVGIEECTCEE